MDTPGPIKNPSRVPMSLQQASTSAELIGTAGVVTDASRQETRIMANDFRFNSQTGHHEAIRDGVYERQAENPASRDRVQMKKGHAVTEADAKVFRRVGPWPGEPDEDAIEAQATEAKAAQTPDNKMAPAPQNKTG